MSVTLSELKSHLRISDTNEDTALQIYLDAAIDFVESQTGLGLTQIARVAYFDSFGDMELYGDNPESITVNYVDSDGSNQVLSSSVYALKVHKARAYLTLAYDQEWPDVQDQDANVWVNYTSGFTAATIPDAIKQAVLVEAGTNFEFRENETMVSLTNRNTVRRLINSRRIINA